MKLPSAQPGPGVAADDPSRPDFWARYYRDGHTPWDIGQPAPPLIRLISSLALEQPLRVLVPGCGSGADALWLARRGHRVTAVDFVAEPLAALRELAQPRLEVLHADLFALPALGRFDLVVEHTCFCAIDPARRPDYVEVVRERLVDSGLLAALFYTHARPGGPPYGVSETELRGLLEPDFEWLHAERPQDSVASRQAEELLVLLRRR